MDEEVLSILVLSFSSFHENCRPKTVLQPHFQCCGEPEMREVYGLWNRLLRMLK